MKILKSSFKDYFFIILGTLIQAIAIRLFFIPANLASGGVGGIAQLINFYTGWPIGLMVFIGNVPLLGWGGGNWAGDGLRCGLRWRLSRTPFSSMPPFISCPRMASPPIWC